MYGVGEIKVMSNMHSSTSLLHYTNMRELGRVSRDDNQHLSDSLTPKRSLRPVLADAPINCRSTYVLRLNANNRLVAAAHGDRSVAIYCANTGALLAKCIGHERSPWSLVFHPSEPYLLASGCLGGEIKIWNIEALTNASAFDQKSPITINCVHTWKRPGSIASIAFHPRHSFLAVAWGQEVVFYDWFEQHVLSTWRFVADQSRLRWLKFSPDGTLLYTATANPPIIPQDASNSNDLSRQTNVSACCVSAHNRYAKLNMEYPPGTPRQYVPRNLLLEFLVRQTECWYSQLNICSTCAVRLCRWAGTLGPIFPTLNTDTQRGWTMAYRVARRLATRIRLSGGEKSNILRHIIQPETSEAIMMIRGDAKPAAVAIIEDTPVQEFLLSRNDYCNRNESSAMFPRGEGVTEGVCCGGHACDLVLTHRELLRHSLCRSCLTGFWCWASCFVAWWEWNPNRFYVDEPLVLEIDIRKLFLPDQQLEDDEDQFMRLLDITDPLSDLDDEFDEPDERQRLVPNFRLLASRPAGICAQCLDSIGYCIRHHNNSNITDDGGSRNIGRYANPAVGPAAAPRSIIQKYAYLLPSSSKPMAAVTRPEMIENLYRASILPIIDVFATEPHPIPYMANSSIPTAPIFVSNVPQLTALNYGHQVDGAFVSSPPKYPRLANDNRYLPPSRGLQHSDHVISTIAEKTYPGNFTYPNLSAVDRSSRLGFSLRNSPQNYQVWNYPRPAQAVGSSLMPVGFPPSRPFWPPIRAFPFVPGGVRDVDTLMATANLAHSKPNEGILCSSPTITACCRCGNIVTETFQVDSRSPLSAIIFESFVFPEKPENYAGRNRYPSISSGHSIASDSLTIDDDIDGETDDDVDDDDYDDDGNDDGNGVGDDDDNEYVDDDADEEEEEEGTANGAGDSDVNLDAPGSTSSDHVSSEQSPFQPNHPSYNSTAQANSNPPANSGNRSISGIIAGLFLEVEEPSSQKSLHDGTYRVCRWELNFCGPVDCTLECPPRKKRSTAARNDNGQPIKPTVFKKAFLPMPANWGASYSANNLVVPHARLFNDSSIALSPDGRVLAAFVLTNEGMENYVNQRVAPTYSRPSVIENVLSVFQLEPKRNLGQCLFSQCFPGTSPVCLDFSPLSNYLAVGMANARCAASVQPLAPRPYGMGGANRSCRLPAGMACTTEDRMEHHAVAHIFRLDRCSNCESDQGVHRILRRVVDIKHPAHLGPISVCSQFTGQHSLDRWHRVLLATPSGVSLNSIVWKPNGGMFYGTNKGMIVMMRVEAEPAKILPQVPANFIPPASTAVIAKTTTTPTNTVTNSSGNSDDYNDGGESISVNNINLPSCSNQRDEKTTAISRYSLTELSSPMSVASTSRIFIDHVPPVTFPG